MKNIKLVWEALIAGKTLICVSNIEVKLNEFGSLSSPNQDPNDIHFRRPEHWSIKPEPMEFWVNIDNSGHIENINFMTIEGARKQCAEFGEMRPIKVREVIE